MPFSSSHYRTPEELSRQEGAMLHSRGRIVFLVLTALMFALFYGQAAAAQRPAQTPAEQYAAAAREWRALLGDQKRGQLRDPWLALERNFLAVAKRDPKGDTGTKATFQAARCLEELAKRSHRADDWKGAVNHYLELTKRTPNHNLADDSLFQAAHVLARRLNEPERARSLAQSVLTKYPKGDMVSNARALIASLPQKPAAKPQPPASSPAKVLQQAKPPEPQPEAARLLRIISRGTSKSSSVLLELDGAASFRHQYLAATEKAPARLVVDIDGISLGADVKPHVQPSGMTVSRIQATATGTGNKKSVRVIIDLNKVRHYTVDAGSSPPGIHVQSSISQDLAGGKQPPADGKNGTVVQGNFAGTTLGRPGTLMEQLGLTVHTIMVDAGHGGKDPGAIGNGIKESTVTLQLAKILGGMLEKQGFSVLYTRENDSTVALDQRPMIANNKKADLFISLHVNASTDKKLNGVETYFLDLARTTGAATVAARENAVSVKSISDLQFILADLMLTSKLQESQDLAAIVHRRMYERLRLAGFTVNDNGVRSAPFYVLMGARMPAILVEIGYLSNENDARRIRSPKYLERLAEGVTSGILEYKNKLSRFNKK